MSRELAEARELLRAGQVVTPEWEKRAASLLVDLVDLIDALLASEQELRSALDAIAFNALSWHHDEEACRRALDVIAAWANDPGLIPEGIGAPTGGADER